MRFQGKKDLKGKEEKSIDEAREIPSAQHYELVCFNVSMS